LADLNPVSVWRRFLALPNESRAKTVGMAFLVSAVCAALVSGATVILRPIQAQNRAAEQQARLDALVAGIPGMSEVLEKAGGTLSTVVIELESGRASSEVTPETLQAALAETGNWTELEPHEDTAGIGTRPNYAQVYVLRDHERVSLVLLPMYAAGYNGVIQATMALMGDLNTIAGLAITQQSETPGLGARIEEPAWLANFPGTEVRDERGEMRFAVARGPATTEYEVDGITGATRTSNAVTRMVRYWLGPDGYGPFLDAIRRGEF
jgi:Na+-transporting NADH:ubiquinone oxidoreductase subunit C